MTETPRRLTADRPQSKREKSVDFLRRFLFAVVGVGLMLLALFRVPIALLERDAGPAIGMFVVGLLGLWLVRLSRPTKTTFE
jgi:hypothetical protein